jgi:hypothetical protein
MRRLNDKRYTFGEFEFLEFFRNFIDQSLQVFSNDEHSLGFEVNPEGL